MLKHDRFTYYQTVIGASYNNMYLKETRDAALKIIEKSQRGEIDLGQPDVFTCIAIIEHHEKMYPGFNSVLINLRWLFCEMNNIPNCSGFIGAYVTSTHNPRNYGSNGNYPSHSQYYGHPTISSCYKNLRLQWLYFVANQCELYAKGGIK